MHNPTKKLTYAIATARIMLLVKPEIHNEPNPTKDQRRVTNCGTKNDKSPLEHNERRKPDRIYIALHPKP